LAELHEKLCRLKIPDTTCHCSQILLITYRELRQLELETLQELIGAQTELTLD